MAVVVDRTNSDNLSGTTRRANRPRTRPGIPGGDTHNYICLCYRCIANGRLLSDGVGNAYVVDVWTHSSYRRRGIATEIMQMLIDSVPGPHIYLQTDDAADFYATLGFKPQPEGLMLVAGEYLQNATRDA